jgi:hypothetical protein
MAGLLPLHGQPKPINDKCFIIVLVDFDFFSCHACADSFLTAYRSLRQEPGLSNIYGIITCQPNNDHSRTEEEYLKIVEKKWSGFCRANDISWPFALDKSHSFRGIAKTGSAIVLIEPVSRTISRYDLPLTTDNMKKIRLAITGKPSDIKETAFAPLSFGVVKTLK